MMRVDAWFLATAPLDMRCGMDSLLERVVGVFGAAQPHTAYAFANPRASRMKVLIHDGFGLWLPTHPNSRIEELLPTRWGRAEGAPRP